MVILIGIGCIVLLEIAITGALLWAYFQLDEWQPKVKQTLRVYLMRLKEKREWLASAEEILLSAKQGQAKAIGKWSMLGKVFVGILEKLARITNHA